MARTCNQENGMRGLTIFFMAAMGFGIAATPAESQDPAGNESAKKIAVDVVTDLANRNFADIVARFTPEMARDLPVSSLDRIWSGIIGQGGAVGEVKEARTMGGTPEGVTLVVVPIRLAKMALDVRVAVAKDRVVGLRIVPSEPAYAPWSAPAYVAPARFTNVEVSIGAPPTLLGGTLTLPKVAHKVAAVVLIHGSGPNDRDETLGPNRVFRDLAEGLGSRGIAVLRYDKRTKVHPEQFTGASTVREETMDDAVAAVALLRTRPEIDPGSIVILGHSLGGMLAPRIAEGGHGIAAAILLAAAARPLPSIMVEQIEYLAGLDGPLDEDAKKQIEQIKSDAARALAAKPGDAEPLIMGAPPAYWADLNAYDPAATAARLSIPLLILQGGRDYQVTSQDLQRFEAALAGRSNVTIRDFPRLNHLFIAGEGKSRPDEYRIPGHLDLSVIDTIATFLAGIPK
jgi:dienelactone hydrolase